MHKKFLLLVLAAAITIPGMPLASNAFYGVTHVTLDWFDIETSSLSSGGREKFRGWAMNRGPLGKGNIRDSRLGFQGFSNLSGNLKAIYQIEFWVPVAGDLNSGFSASSSKLDSSPKMRNSFVGLKGDFGTLFLGRYDTPLKRSTEKLDLFNDTMADNQGTLGFDDIRASEIISYITPSLGGLQFTAAIMPGAENTYFARYVDNQLENPDATNLAAAYSFAGVYASGPWYASTAYEVITKQLLSPAVGGNGPLADYKKWRVGLGIWDLGGLSLSAIYEKQKSLSFMQRFGYAVSDSDVWQGQIGYRLGNNMIKAMYGQKSYVVAGASEKRDWINSWALGFDHNFNNRTRAYFVYANIDTPSMPAGRHGALDWKGFSIGMKHKF